MGGACSGDNTRKEDAYAPPAASGPTHRSGSPSVHVLKLTGGGAAEGGGGGGGDDPSRSPHTPGQPGNSHSGDDPNGAGVEGGGGGGGGGIKPRSSPKFGAIPSPGDTPNGDGTDGGRHSLPLLTIPQGSQGHGGIVALDGTTPMTGGSSGNGGQTQGQGGMGGGATTPFLSDPALAAFVRPPPATVPLHWAEPSGFDESEEMRRKEEVLDNSFFACCALGPEQRQALLASSRLHRAPLGARVFSQQAESAEWLYIVAQGLVRLEVFSEHASGSYAVGAGGEGGIMLPAEEHLDDPDTAGTFIEESELLGRDEQHEQDLLHDFLTGANNLGTFLSPKHGQLTRAEAQAAEAAAQAAAAAKAEKAAREAHQARRAAAAAAKEKERSDRLKTSTDMAFRTQASQLLATMATGGAAAVARPNAAKEKEIRDKNERSQGHHSSNSIGGAVTPDLFRSPTGPGGGSDGGSGGGGLMSSAPSPQHASGVPESPASMRRASRVSHGRGLSGQFTLPPAGLAPLMVPPSPDGGVDGTAAGGGPTTAAGPGDSARSVLSNGTNNNNTLKSPTAARTLRNRQSSHSHDFPDLLSGGGGGNGGGGGGGGHKLVGRMSFGEAHGFGGGGGSGLTTPHGVSPRTNGQMHSTPMAAEVESIPDGPGTVRICIKQPTQAFGLCGFIAPQSTTTQQQPPVYQSTAVVHVPDTLLLCIPRASIESLYALANSTPLAVKRARDHVGVGSGGVLSAVSSAPWLKHLSSGQQVLLASLFAHGRIAAGVNLFSNGECTVDSSPIFLLLEGCVEVTLTDERGRVAKKRVEVASGGRARFVGELAPVVGLCRTGTVATITTCVVRVLQRRWLTLFYRIAAHEPLAQQACQSLLSTYQVRDEQLLEQMDVQSAFGLFCLREYSAENVEFWQTAVRFRKVIAPSVIRSFGAPAGTAETGPLPTDVPGLADAAAFTKQEVLTEAALLYTRYISERSLVQINLKEGVRSSVLQALRAGTLRADSFLRAEAEILHLMLHDNWTRFKAHKSFALSCSDLEPPEPQPILLLPREASPLVRAIVVASDTPWLHAAATAAATALLPQSPNTTTNTTTAATATTPGGDPASPLPPPALLPSGATSPMTPLTPVTPITPASPLPPSATTTAPASITVEFRWGPPVGRQVGELLFNAEGDVRTAENELPPPPTIVIAPPADAHLFQPMPLTGGGGGVMNNNGKLQRFPSLPVVIDSPFIGSEGGPPSIMLHTPQGSMLPAPDNSGGAGAGGATNWMLQHPGESLLGAVASTTAGGGGGGTDSSSGLATPTNEQSGSNSQPLTPQSARGGGQMSARGGGGGGVGVVGDGGLLSAPTSPLARNNNGNVDSAPGPSPSELLGREFSLSVGNNGGGGRRSTLNPDRPPVHSRPGTLGGGGGGGGGRTHSVFGGGHRRASRHNISPFGLAAAHGHGPRDQNALIAEAVFAQSVYTAAQHQQMQLAQMARDAHGERSGSGVPIPLSPHTAAYSPLDGGGGIGSNLNSPHGPTSSSSSVINPRRSTGGRETMANITLAVKRGHHVHQKLKASPFNVPQARRK